MFRTSLFFAGVRVCADDLEPVGLGILLDRVGPGFRVSIAGVRLTYAGR